jgi:AraC family transcriptional regulator of adaptative response / DNA-3-methyladenine glycosylase II
MPDAPLDPDACYAAISTRDARFDGRFFVGVSSTGIYCRPTCHSKLPKRENCTFFRTAAEAEAAGYRPCLQCRPETAPGYSPADAMTSLAQRTARAIEDDYASITSLEDLSTRLGYTSRHVRRAFEQEFHVSPRQYLETCRLLLAKNLLTETTLPVSEVALACGFKSVRRFNDAFVERYRMPPTKLRKNACCKRNGSNKAQVDATIRVTLGYRPPYAWDRILAFLAPRAIPGVEVVKPPTAPDARDGLYARTARLLARDGSPVTGWVRVTHHPRRDALVLEASDSLALVLPQVITRIKDLFDLRCEPVAIAQHLSGMSAVSPQLPIVGLRVPGCFDPFEMATRAVLGQQISVKAATTLAGRLATNFGTPLQTPIEGLTCTFPTAEDLLALGNGFGDALGQLGVTRQRQRTIHALAEGISSGAILTDSNAEPDEQIVSLVELPGIGDWTANYLAMRILRYTDAFPASDLGVRKVLAPRTPREIKEFAQNWSPWRAYATLNLWNVEEAT